MNTISIRRARFTLVDLCATLSMGILSISLLAFHTIAMMKNRQTAQCANKLHTTYLALATYAESTRNYCFPSTPGWSVNSAGDRVDIRGVERAAGGLEILRGQDFLSDYEDYVCPSSEATVGRRCSAYNMGMLAYDVEPRKCTVSYAYRDGLNFGKSPSVGIVADITAGTAVLEGRPNHRNSGNVLFTDGRVATFYGSSWFNAINLGEEADLYPNIMRRNAK